MNHIDIGTYFMYIYINYTARGKRGGLKSLEIPMQALQWPESSPPANAGYTIAEINPASMATTSSAAIAVATIFCVFFDLNIIVSSMILQFSNLKKGR